MTERIDVKITADGSGLLRASKEASTAVKNLGATFDAAGKGSANAFRGLGTQLANLRFEGSINAAKLLGSTISTGASAASNKLRDLEKQLRRIGSTVIKNVIPTTAGDGLRAEGLRGGAGAGAGVAGIGLAAGLGAGVGAGLSKAQKEYNEAVRHAAEVQQIANKAYEDSGVAMERLDGITENAKRRITEYKAALNEFNAAQTKFNELTEEAAAKNAVNNKQMEAALLRQQEILDSLKQLAAQQEEFQDAIDETGDADGAFRKGLNATSKEIANLEASAAANQLVMENLGSEIDALENKLNEAEEAARLAEKAFKDLERAQEQQRESERKATEEIGKFKDELEGVITSQREAEKRVQETTEAVKKQSGVISTLKENWSVLTAAIAAAGVVFYKIAEDISSDEQALARLYGAFADAPGEIQPMLDLADKLGNTNFFDPEASYEAAALLHNLGATQKQMEILLPAAVRFAAIYGGTVAEAARKLANGMTNSTESLRDFGINLRNDATAAERYAAVIKRDSKAMEEFDLLGQGMTNRLAGIKRAFDDLLGSLGKDFGGQLKVIAGLVEIVIRSFSVLGSGLKAVSVAISNALTSPFVVMAAAIDGFKTGGFAGMKTAAKGAADYLTEQFDEAFKNLADNFKTFKDDSKRILKEIYTGMKPPGTKEAKKKKPPETDRGLVPKLPEDKEADKRRKEEEAWQRFLDNLNKALANTYTTEGIQGVVDRFNVLNLSGERLEQATDLVGQRFTQLAGEEMKQWESERDAAKRLADYEFNLQKQLADDLSAAADQLAGAFNTLTTVFEDGKATISEGLSVLGGAGRSVGGVIAPSDPITGAIVAGLGLFTEASAEVFSARERAEERFKEAVETFAGSVAENNKGLVEYQRKLGIVTDKQARFETARQDIAAKFAASPELKERFGNLEKVLTGASEEQFRAAAEVLARGGSAEDALRALGGTPFAPSTRSEARFSNLGTDIFGAGNQWWNPLNLIPTFGSVNVATAPQMGEVPLTEESSKVLENAIISLANAITEGQEQQALLGSAPTRPLYVYDVTPAEEQFMFAPRTFFFREAAQSRSVGM